MDEFGWHVDLDQRYVKSLLDAMESMATPGSKGQEGNSATEKLDAKEHREFRSGAGICQCMTKQRFDIAFSTKEIIREAAGPTTASKTKLQRIARYLNGRQRCVLNFPWVSKAGRRHPCDGGCRLDRRPEDKVLNVWRSIGNWPVLHGTSLVGDTGNSVTIVG